MKISVLTLLNVFAETHTDPRLVSGHALSCRPCTDPSHPDSFHASDIYLYGGTAEVSGVTPVVDNSYMYVLNLMYCTFKSGRSARLTSI